MAARLRSYSVTQVEESIGPALRQARDGATVEITAHGRVVARLVPAAEDPVLAAVGRFRLPARTIKLAGDRLASDAVLEDRE